MDPSLRQGALADIWYKNTVQRHNITEAQLVQLLHDPTWMKAVFYRDPVERFRSAYISKVTNESILCVFELVNALPS